MELINFKSTYNTTTVIATRIVNARQRGPRYTVNIECGYDSKGVKKYTRSSENFDTAKECQVFAMRHAANMIEAN